MAILVTCSCGKCLRATDAMAGRQVRCPACEEVVDIPTSGPQNAVAPLDEPSPQLADSYRLANEPHPEPSPSSLDTQSHPAPEPTERRARRSVALSNTRSSQAAEAGGPWHWLLVLALVPLALSLLQHSAPEPFDQRLRHTVEKYSPEERDEIFRSLMWLGRREGTTLDDVLDILPEHRLADAHLSRKSQRHWFYAGGAAVLFFSFLLLICPTKGLNPLSLLAIGLFTATIGILFLIAVQYLAAWTDGRWYVGRGIVTLLFYIAKFIGFSYQSALRPDSNVILSLFGFTFGIGFCEELCKALPLLWHFRRSPSLGWRGAFLWGLASGAGFGISEGIMYAGNHYNGIAPASTYLVRFISCVALHAVWSGSVGITIYQCQKLWQQEMNWYEFIPLLFRILGVAMVLHGLYDTLLKKDMNTLALWAAVLSFGWLAWQVSHLSSEEEPAPAPASA